MPEKRTIFELNVPEEVEKNKVRSDHTEWVMAAEYMKAKQTFDTFSDNFGQVNFTMPRLNQDLLTSENQRRERENERKDIQFAREFTSLF